MESPLKKNAMRTTVFRDSIYRYFISSKDVDVEYFGPIGNVHEEK